jgi:alkaline phosphatase
MKKDSSSWLREVRWTMHATITMLFGRLPKPLALDYAIAEAMAFAAKNPDTLIVVAADHETGALAIGKGISLIPLASGR